MGSKPNKPEIIDDSDNENLKFGNYQITTFGTDYPVDGLAKRMEDKIIYVPDFQRAYIWTDDQASKFIESLLLGLPVPSIFLAKEERSGRYLIIDGQQRLITIQKFYSNILKLQNVDNHFNRKTYSELSDREQRRLDNVFIHAIIVSPDTPADENAIYMIFERLNTGGEKLEAQEIRQAIYYGVFSDFLDKCTKHKAWQNIFGTNDQRRKHQELILRFFALYFEAAQYKKPMKLFLNNFMSKNRQMECYSQQTLTELFENTISLFSEALGNKAFKLNKQFNAAFFDAMMVAVAKTKPDIAKIQAVHEILIKDTNFIKDIKSGTTDEKKIISRFNTTISLFAK